MAEIEIPRAEGKAGEKHVGILIAIIAVLMAIVGAMGHNAANEMIVDEVKSSNGFAWYQAKRQREYVNDLELKRIEVELAGNPTEAQRTALARIAADLKSKNIEYHAETEKIQSDARHHGLRARIADARNEWFDYSEILLQVAVVLCSLTLLTESRLFLRIGIVVALIGVGLGCVAFTRKAEAAPEESTPAAAGHAGAVR